MSSTAYEVSYVIQWVVICVLIVGLGALYSAFGALTKRLGLLASPALDLSFMGPTIGDEVIARDEIFDEHGSILRRVSAWVFVTPGCAGCARAKAALQNASSNDFGEEVAVVINGPREQADVWMRDLPPWTSFVPDEDGRLFNLFNIRATPYYVLLDETGRCVAKGPSEAALIRPVHEARVHNAGAAETIQRTAIPVETSSASRA
jgi:hypothetical protein